MKKAGKMRLALVCAVVVTTGAMSYTWRGGKASGAEVHMEKPTPTRLLMRLISSHTSKILEAIVIGDYNTVQKEAKAVADNSSVILNNFFPQGGQVGEWFKDTGKDPNDPKAVAAMKADFEKYLGTVIDSANNIAATAKKKNIVDTYKSFDEMMANSCFGGCHEAFRPKWPEWGWKEIEAVE